MWDEPDDIVIEWARKQDVFSDQVVYEMDVSFGARGHGVSRKHAETEDGVIDIDKDTLGSFREQEAVEECRRLGFVLLERILLMVTHSTRRVHYTIRYRFREDRGKLRYGCQSALAHSW